MKHLRKVLLILIVAVLGSCLVDCTPGTEETWAEEIEEQPTSTFSPKVQYNMIVNELFTEQHQVQRNQQFIDLLQNYKISQTSWLKLNSLSRKEFDFRKVKSGQNYSLFIRPDSTCSLQALVYEMTDTEYAIFHFNDSLRLEFCEKEVSVKEKIVSGVIESTLSETIRSQGISHALTNRFVDIMGWQIDFYHLQKGDYFKIIYEEQSVDGNPIGVGDISGIFFKHAGRDFWAVPFDQGEGQDYFDLEGNSIRRAFLKYPIEFTHISSRYSLNRFHPVLKVNRPHLGTDLSAATGTPIRSVGDGFVIEAGYNGGSGNYVKIRHNGTYTTGYLHMSKIGMGIRKGTAVKQGQVIGYVGSTGWATGPHLCYRFWKNGIQVDALKVIIPPAKPVNDGSLENYSCIKMETVNKIRLIGDPFEHAFALR